MSFDLLGFWLKFRKFTAGFGLFDKYVQNIRLDINIAVG